MVVYKKMDTSKDPICTMYAELFMVLEAEHSSRTCRDQENSVGLLLTEPPYGTRYEQERTNCQHSILAQ